MRKDNYFVWLFHEIRRVLHIMVDEYRLVFRDSGLVVVFVIAALVYPPLYSYIYHNETIRDVPIAVVDESHTQASRELIRDIDATPDLVVAYARNSVEECKDLLYRDKIHGVVYIPRDFSDKIARNEQAMVSMYTDMSSFLYYRAMMFGANLPILQYGKDVKVKRLNAMGVTGKAAEITADPLGHEAVILYNESMGFFSFLIPALLILMIHQTLFFGITMVNGTLREDRALHASLQVKQRGKFFQILLGKTLCYLTLEMVLASYILLIIPRVFHLPHLGNPVDIMLFIIPMILGVVFLSMSFSVFVRNRETAIVIGLFFSLILLFLSGFSWPQSNISWVWKTFAMLFPSTYGIQGFLKLNSMGADLSLVKYEVVALWLQVIFYFLLTMIVFRVQGKVRKEEV